MKVNGVSCGRLAVLAVGAVLADGGGGRAQKEPRITQPPAVNPPAPAQETDVEKRVEELKRRADELTRLAATLPPASDAEYREKVQQVFAQLSQTLPLLGGPNAGGGFEYQVSAVTVTRARLASTSPDLVI